MNPFSTQGPSSGRIVLLAAAVFAFSLTCLTAHSQSAYPNKAVRMVVPYPPGGPNDIIARLVAQKLTERLKQTFVIDNRPGATGLTGTDNVAKSPADGYTLLVSASVHVIYPALFNKVPFDPLKDFVGVTQLARTPLVLSVYPGFEPKSVRELIAEAKVKPGTLQYASSGNGSATHLSAEAFKSQAKIDVTHVPYKGSSPAMMDVMAGHVPIIFDSLGSTLPFVKSGKLRALAVTSATRSPAAPDLPTMAEAGLPGYDISTWFGLWAPAGTPKDVVEKIAAEVRQILRTPEVVQDLTTRGIEPVGSTPSEFAAYQVSETAKWARVVKDSGAKMD
jgi:tripartite-type tricarboxylate transporter receptor subunit TctC